MFILLWIYLHLELFYVYIVNKKLIHSECGGSSLQIPKISNQLSVKV